MLIPKIFSDVYSKALFESLDIKTHYKARVIRAAWYQQRKSENTEQQFRNSKIKKNYSLG